MECIPRISLEDGFFAYADMLLNIGSISPLSCATSEMHP